MQTHALRLILAMGAIMACSGGASTSPRSITSGTYPLRSYNNRSLPVDIGILPPKGQNPGGCHILVTAGSLTIDTAQLTFAYAYDVRDACDQRLLSQPSLSGTFEQHGRDISFVVSRVDGNLRFGGSLLSEGILVRNGDELLQFSR